MDKETTFNPVVQEIEQASVGDIFLYQACLSDHVNVVSSLLKKRAFVNTVYSFEYSKNKFYEITPLIIAIKNRSNALLSCLLYHNADPNLCVPITGLSPITVAAYHGLSGMIELLLSSKADPNVSDSCGGSPLLAAVETAHAKVVTVLLQAKACVDKEANREYTGVTPLIQAAQQGHAKILSLLIAARADVNKPRCDGRTPLHLAVFNNRLPVVETLRDAGVDIHVCDIYGKSPLNYAKKKRCRRLLDKPKQNPRSPRVLSRLKYEVAT